MHQHEIYMRRCLELAALGMGNVSPNPMVGAVIVHNDQIIGEGYHQQYGKAHAEVNAINQVIDKYADYAELLKDFADFFGCSIQDNTLTLPSDIGDGYMKLIELPNGLQGIISDYIVHKEILFKRTKINEDYFTLRFDEVFIPDT